MEKKEKREKKEKERWGKKCGSHLSLGRGE